MPCVFCCVLVFDCYKTRLAEIVLSGFVFGVGFGILLRVSFDFDFTCLGVVLSA